ncbi:MAG: hypothetical protein IJO33_00555 [Bacilli bacterium]|nr:hypothetical protein [Bacilli bacterium]
MEIIKYNDINFERLEKLPKQGNFSTIYCQGDVCYKLFENLNDAEIEVMLRKFLEMDGIQIVGAIFPKTLIMHNNKFVGYTMDYYKGAITLFDMFQSRYVSCKALFSYVIKATDVLKKLHENGIIYQDLNFENILVDNEDNIHFCDMDACCYNNLISPFIPAVMQSLWINYRKETDVFTEKVDRISMLTSLLHLIYAKEIQEITPRKYDKLSRNVRTLENLRPIFDMLVDVNRDVEDIPYLDELIDRSDDYVFDRNKLLGFSRLLKKY